MPRTGRIDLVRHLEYFVAIAEEGQVGRAADRLDMAQPPLSQGLQRLERHLGETLFHRSARGVQLTAAGVDLLPRARHVLAGVRALFAAGAPRSTSLRVGVPGLLPAPLAAALAAGLAAERPDGPVELIAAPTLDLVDAVAAGRLAAALVTHPAVTAGARAGEVVRLSTRALLPTSAAGPGGPVRLGDLPDLPLALPSRSDNPPWFDLAAEVAAAAGLRIGRVPAPDDRSALALAAGGGAVGLTADPTLTGPGVIARPLAGDPLPLRLRLIWPPEADAGPLRAAIPRLLRGAQP